MMGRSRVGDRRAAPHTVRVCAQEQGEASTACLIYGMRPASGAMCAWRPLPRCCKQPRVLWALVHGVRVAVRRGGTMRVRRAEEPGGEWCLAAPN